MKDRYYKKAFSMFEAYQNQNLSQDDLDEAEAKSVHLDGKMSDFKLLIHMVRDVMAGRYKMDKWNMAIIVGTIAYVLSPLDAIPDIIPVLGWLDDVTIVGYALSKLSQEIKRYKGQVTVR